MKSPGKYFFLLLTALLPVLLLLSTCSNPVLNSGQVQTNMSAAGSLQINLVASETDRSVVPQEYFDAIETYEVLLSGTQSLGPLQVSDTLVLLEDLPLGDYTVSVTALDAKGISLAAGSESNISVSGEETGTVDIMLLPVMGGQGSIDISYDWTSSELPAGNVDKVLAVITPSGGISIPVDVELSDNGFQFAGDYPSGEYVFTSELFSDGVLVSTISETVQVFNGIETVSSTEYGPEIFQVVPKAPDYPLAQQKGLSVELSWVDTSDFETGFEIYRSEDGGDFTLQGTGLPANTVSWTDSPVVPDTLYTYRIVAVNDFGPSDSQDYSITVDPLISAITASQYKPAPLILGDSGNTITLSELLRGFENRLNRSVLEVLKVSAGGGAEARIEGGNVVIDTSQMPYELEGQTVSLEYVVHIAGEPLNETYSTTASIQMELMAPAVETITEDELLEPVTGFIYDNRTDLERKMRLYEPPGPQEIFENWGRVSNSEYFNDGEDARAAKDKKGDEADLALMWKLKTDHDETYLEYSRNSVYAGFVSSEGEESDQFTLEATVSSKDDDNDTIGLIVAFLRDGDSSYVLEAARSQGSSSGNTFIEPREGWGLIVRRLSPDAENPEIGDVLWIRQLNVGGVSSQGWKNSSSRIKVVRSGDRVTISTTDWNDENNYVPGSVIDVDLNSDPELSRFSGPQKYGYFTASQERTSFKDIVLNGGVIQDKLFYLNPETGESEVWWYDRSFKRWIPMAGVDVQGLLGYPLEVTNPETGETYLIERRGFRRGRWEDWRNLWEKWDRWNVPEKRGRSGRNKDE